MIATRLATLQNARSSLCNLTTSDQQLVYTSPDFLDFLENVTQGEACVVLAETADEIVGALPYVARRVAGVGTIINSLPWWGSHGSCILDRRRENADNIRRALLAGFKSHLDKIDLVSATMILSHDEEAARALYVSALSPTATDARIGQVTRLPNNPMQEDTLLTMFAQKTRNLVRKSLKQGFTEVVADDDDAWGFLHRVHVQNISALGGKPKPLSHFSRLRETLPTSARRLSLAMDGETPIAALLLLYAGKTVEYVTPAIEVSARSRQPLSFLIWKGMLNAVDRNFTSWNWGGTWKGQASLHHFKAGFGAEDRPYSYLICATPEGIAKLQKHHGQLDIMYPYFYAYPYSLLNAASDPV